MAAQFWVADFFVDVSRNQLTHGDHVQTMAPKALAVLKYLAENQGEVVSHEVLLDEVWLDTAVTPNTLQRSIAQLRKALGDDAKAQRYIKTHAKQGYSLACDVRWPETFDATPSHREAKAVDLTAPGTNHRVHVVGTKSASIARGLKRAVVVAGLVIVSIVGYQNLAPRYSEPLTFDTLRSLTATDDKEFDATYSPDGQYITFHRYYEKQCINKIWAKNIETQQEIQLTRDWGNYGRHSFSKDGKSIVFLATETCSTPVCYNLMTINFEKALETPQEPSLMLQCKHTALRKPTWLNNGSIALMQNVINRWQLIRYMPSDNSSITLYGLENGSLIDYAYSARDDILAVIRMHPSGKYYIEMLSVDGEVLSSYPIDYPQNIAKFRPIFPTFDPLNDRLVFSTGRQLFTLSYRGEVAKMDLPFADRMVQPVFHPEGNRVLLIKGPYDSDIVLLPRHQLARENVSGQAEQAATHPPLDYESFERSNLGEDYAMFQPGGDLIAFWSERSGEQQLWVSDGKGPRQLTQFPMDTYIRGMDWAADGQSLLVNANSALTQVFLDSTQVSISWQYPVIQLFQWESEYNRALVLARINGMIQFVTLELNQSEYRVVTEKRVKWARKSAGGALIYKDHLDQFWRPGPAEDQHIAALDQQGTRAETFVMEDNRIYAINRANQLWSYDLDRDTFQVIGRVGDDVDYLTDVDQDQLLVTVQMSAKKEVVELSISESTR